ncbi:Rho guanine nucleotide exchange factor [Perilla frutescens var. hirtella]|uniref:Rho guanine nucleotide exchange factor n=1 Tax=Perilla frutescens var. hirtella TaxID=608512 RepID=A0AAD4JG08_PERFH|nr:Rho guanine nucleotide exchange factor [Perilla frutescens var. hirtella]
MAESDAPLPTNGHHSKWRLSAGSRLSATTPPPPIYAHRRLTVVTITALLISSTKKPETRRIKKMAETTKQHSLFPLETCPHVPDEAFRQFHTIDRELYVCLTRKLRRDPAESVQVMAFLMWLERECRLNFIKQMSSLPPLLLNQIANETAMCVKCVESDAFLFGDDGNNEIKILTEFLNFPSVVSLRFFHENRISVLRGVAKIINTVCWRAFGDLFHGECGGGSVAGLPVPVPFIGESSWEAEKRAVERHGGGGGGGVVPPPPHVMQMMYNPYHDVPPPLIRMPPPPHMPLRPPVVADVIGLPLHMLAAGGFPVYDVAAQRQMLNNELGELMKRNLNITNTVVEDENREEEVSPDDRTIFLTFSKGYPTSEEEVKEYFTKKFGDFIEDLIMQEVEEGEQPLYAKMVAKSPAVMDGIVEGNKAKYSIGGKHVWARKYVRKPPPRSPPRGEASGSSPSAAPGKKA